jgi:hypothetical protein
MEFIAGRGATGGTGAGSAINVGGGSGETGNGVVCQWVELDPSVVQAVELLCLRRLGPIGLIVSKIYVRITIYLVTPVGGVAGVFVGVDFWVGRVWRRALAPFLDVAEISEAVSYYISKDVN